MTAHSLTRSEIEAAHQVVLAAMPATPQYCWPLLSQRVGTEVWIKHENHTPTGSFKMRGGLVYCERLAHYGVKGVVAGTRGNHGQSVAFAARRYGMTATIVTPYGNSVEKNAAMRALGASLIEYGRDFQEALDHAAQLDPGLHMIQSFAPELTLGVSTYGYELFQAVPQLDVVYVAVGLGSGLCGLIAARDALGLKTRLVGVVAEGADAYAQSFRRGVWCESESVNTFADGIACRKPHPDALAIIREGADNVVSVSDADIAHAIACYYTDTHNLAEGAGAAALAAALKQLAHRPQDKVGIILSGGNIDLRLFLQKMNEHATLSAGVRPLSALCQ